MGYRQYLPLTLGKPIFFVSLDGSDADGDGTFENPWRTIGKGVSLLSAWDTLYIRGGTYVEQITISRSGTADAPITIAAYPGEKVVVDGRAGVDGLNEGLPDNGELILPPESRFGTGFRYTPLVSIEANYIIFEGIEVTRSMGRGIRVWRDGKNTRGVIIRDCKISFSRNSGILMEQRCQEITIENCDISRSSNFAPYDRPSSELDWGGACVVKGSHDVIIRGTSIHENWGEGIISDSQTFKSSKVLISECIFYDNMRPSIYIHAVSDFLVEKNLLYHSSNPEFPSAEGIAIIPSESQFAEDIDIEDVTIVNNIIVGLGINLALYGPEGRYLRRIRVLFNTLVNGQDYGIVESAAHFESCELKNNIVFQNNGRPVVNSSGVFMNWSISHNAWSYTPPDNVGSDGDVVGDPQLENPQGERIQGQVDPDWYKIKANSPVIGQAITIQSVAQDFFNNNRDVQSDIGAHEFQKEVLTAVSTDASIDDKARPLFCDKMVLDTLSARGFKRFVILSDSSVPSPENIMAFGIQFPDQQCLVFDKEQQDSPMVFRDVGQALDECKKPDTMLQWLD